MLLTFNLLAGQCDKSPRSTAHTRAMPKTSKQIGQQLSLMCFLPQTLQAAGSTKSSVIL